MNFKKLNTGIKTINDNGTIRVNSPYDNDVTSYPINPDAYYLDEILYFHFNNLSQYYNQIYLK